ncbi:MAG TPA: hypothetical protein VLC09_19435, partial [Polyangiaceae bacterium]|nr:hypothetical protein [Polyangiaceae bacterium]
MKNIGRYLMALVGVGMAFACGGGGSSGLQQTCSNSGDCESGLLCMAGVCVQNDYPVDTTSK